MNPGHVYILTNEAMPGLVKIGRTSRDVDVRASELWQTGVPHKFEVFTSERSYNCVQLEAFVHRTLARHRVTRQREFFAIDPPKASETLKFWAEHQAFTFLNDHFDCSVAVPWLEYVCDIDRISEETGQSTQIVTAAMAALTAGELEPAIKRVLEDRRREAIEDLRAAGIPEEDWEDLLDE